MLLHRLPSINNGGGLLHRVVATQGCQGKKQSVLATAIVLHSISCLQQISLKPKLSAADFSTAQFVCSRFLYSPSCLQQIFPFFIVPNCHCSIQPMLSAADFHCLLFYTVSLFSTAHVVCSTFPHCLLFHGCHCFLQHKLSAADISIVLCSTRP